MKGVGFTLSKVVAKVAGMCWIASYLLTALLLEMLRPGWGEGVG